MTAAKYIVEVDEDNNVFWFDYNNPDNFHRLGGLPACEYANGDKEYYVNGLRHRLNGPAVEFVNGTKFYFENGKKHRIDGPAYESANGYKEYWFEDVQYSYEDWLAKINIKEKEMTVAEIEAQLGYSIKIVK